MSITPFRPHIDIRSTERLHAKLKDIRVPTNEILPSADKAYGVPHKWASELFNYWQNTYSWPAAEGRINQFEHFTADIEQINLHFVHQKAHHAPGNAKAILLIHGWPGSFYEFSDVIKPLTEGEGQKFHCVVPSLPGFCFSSAPPRKGWTVKDTARVLDELMQRLGYTEYAVQAGDWGAMVARELGATFAGRCKVMHLNWCPGALPEGVQDVTERERWCEERKGIWRTEHVGYAVLMRTRPQSVSWMLEDNPVGLMTFIGEKYEEASNPAVHYTPHWMDHVLTTVCLYFHTRSIGTSALLYYENPRHDQFAAYCGAPENAIKCPFGYTSMQYDTSPNSKRAAGTTGNLVWYKERDDAGHFACLEAPHGIVEDVREVVAKFWSGNSS
ncbi:hypothetical protein CERZMDRAFT_37823 [Cercospora zeae-maydis SCOH1-5]|uniref:Epoxide hydrolase N-terminal domain-containing protein n=1 Tax=Cercospora zeae-maydis SCOH1-5 TaxID=717836 RepID=A0A6A6FLN2_9PEZI|nr:hypothetical protein CERZMDRAFT_37823 [Cercospora zeae-maydis SCOH1-5]